MDISRYLKHDKEQADRRNFEYWARRQISTATALRRFIKNNEIPEDVIISEGEFETWVRSLGYARPKI